MSFRTFKIPLRDEPGFNPKYSLFEDVGLDPNKVHGHNYVDVYGINIPPADCPPFDSWIENVNYTHFLNPDEGFSYKYRKEITLWDTDPDTILRLASLPGVEETATTIEHLTRILRAALIANKPVDDILEAIKNL